MVNQARGSIFKRTDGKYIYLPTRLIEDTAFPISQRQGNQDTH